MRQFALLAVLGAALITAAPASAATVKVTPRIEGAVFTDTAPQAIHFAVQAQRRHRAFTRVTLIGVPAGARARLVVPHKTINLTGTGRTLMTVALRRRRASTLTVIVTTPGMAGMTQVLKER